MLLSYVLPRSVTLPEEAEDEERARDLSWETWLARRTAQVLARGLSDRVTLLRTRALVLDQYELDYAPTELGRQVIVGLILNPETAQRLVDLGPPADDTAKVCSFTRNITTSCHSRAACVSCVLSFRRPSSVSSGVLSRRCADSRMARSTNPSVRLRNPHSRHCTPLHAIAHG